MKVELGPLPPPVMRPFVIGDVYDADQMRAYAQQEVAKERERWMAACESVIQGSEGFYDSWGASFAWEQAAMKVRELATLGLK